MADDQRSGSGGISEDALRRGYQEILPRLTRLREESEWELHNALQPSGIKLHSLSARVKTEESFVEKAGRKAYANPWDEVEDLVGLRAVCLFRSDLTRLEEIVRGRFEVFREEDTVEGGSVDSFGYMSVHMNARIHPDRAGPRYSGIMDLPFEIQLRTIVMDAWANVSHYLDYKGESSIPPELRRDFLALSGLFYVADQHFELFVRESGVARADAARTVSQAIETPAVDINLDTMLAYLHRRYPDREQSDAAKVSALVEELARFGHTRLDKLDAVLSLAEERFLEQETAEPPFDGDRYTDVGAARLTLSIGDPDYGEWRSRNAKDEEEAGEE
jgi:putative GTP pyrophosphokinase